MSSAEASRTTPAWARLALTGACILLILARFMPTQPIYPDFDPDKAWAWGVNFATAHGMAFGRDMIFTYGPYAAVATRMYDPGLRGLTVGGCAILALAFIAGILALARGRISALCCLALALPLAPVTDALAFALPLPAILLCAQTPPGCRPGRRAVVATAALLPALALLPLVKFSFVAAVLPTLLTLIVLLWRAGALRVAAALPVLFLVLLALLWLAAGQSLAWLPFYFASGLQIIAGYNDAMSAPGPLWVPVLAFLWAWLLLGLLAWGGRQLPRPAALSVIGCVALIVFLVIKAGNVRQDPGHQLVCTCALGLMFLILAVWLRGVASIAASVAGLAVLVGASGSPTGAAADDFRFTSEELTGATRLLVDQDALRRDYDTNISRIPRLPWHVAGTADIYSSGQAMLLASKAVWAPRPVLQSYSAYTDKLARLDPDHLLSAGRPDNIFFRLDTIDQRLPALEDGLSWPALLSLYDAQAYDDPTGLLWLRRAPASAVLAQPGEPITDSEETLATPVALPAVAGALWARIETQPTLAGRVAGTLLRPARLQIGLGFADGSTAYFRLVPAMARSGFLLSPLVTTALEFGRLRPGAADKAPALKRPVSLVVQTGPGHGWAWRTHYRLVLAPLALPPAAAPVAIQGTLRPRLSAAPPPVPAPPRSCALDGLNNGPAPGGTVSITWPVVLTGWAVFDSVAGVPADTIKVGLRGADGALYEVPALRGPRGDVADAFHHPALSASGFATGTDLSALPPGDYGVVALASHGGAVRSCAMGLTLRLGEPK